MSHTNATVIIAAADQPAAQADFPGSFTSGFADPSGATFYVCSGLWADEDLAHITDGSVTWPSQVYHNDVGKILAQLELSPIPPPDSSQTA